MKLITILITIISIGIFTSCSKSYERTYEESLEKYLEVSGQTLLNNPMIDQMKDFPMMGSVFGNNDNAKNEVDTLFVQMESKIKALYKDYLTQDDLEKLIEFYESALGRKLVKTNQKVTIEAFKFSQELVMERMEEITKNFGGPYGTKKE